MPLAPKVMVGSTEIKRAHLGSTLLFDRTAPTVAQIEAIAQVAAVFVAEPAYLFQDTAAATLVTTSGQTVGAWKDTSGLYTLTLAGSGVTYHASGGLAWVESDGNGRLEGAVPDGWSPPLLLAVAATREVDAYTIPMSIMDSTQNSDGYWVALTNGNDSGIRPRYFSGATNIDCWTAFSTALSTAYVINAIVDSSAGTARARINGSADQDADQVSNFNVGIYPGGTNHVFAVCGEGGGTPGNDPNKVFAAVVALGLPAAADRDLIDRWLAARSGAALDGVTP